MGVIEICLIQTKNIKSQSKTLKLVYQL